MNQTIKGTVRWFDRSSGTGCIRDEDGNSVRVFACNIIGSKSWFEHLACVYLEQGQSVTFEYVEGCGACKVTGGILDAEQWDRIKVRDDLAFTQNEAGVMSGLFKTRGAK